MSNSKEDTRLGKTIYTMKITGSNFWRIEITIIGYTIIARHPVDTKMYCSKVSYSKVHSFNKDGEPKINSNYDCMEGDCKDVYWKTIDYHSYESVEEAYKTGCKLIEDFSVNILKVEAKKFDLLD